MQIFHFHPSTGEYLGVSEAAASPLEGGKFLDQAYSTRIAPPELATNQAAVFNGDEWSVLSDYRGVVYWFADGSIHTIEVLGDTVPIGGLLEPPAVLSNHEQQMKDIVNAIQLRLDHFAQTRGYDGILSACTYAASTSETFRGEGEYCVSLRDATWSKAYELLSEVKTGRDPYTIDEVMGALPVPSWPKS